MSAGTASRAVRPISASACAARRRSSGSLLFSAATQSAVATPRYDGRPNMRSLRGLANRISFTTIGDEGRLPINPLRTNQESLHDMEQEDLLLRCHLRGIGCALGSAALPGAITVSTAAQRAVKNSCALPQHVTVLCIGRRHLRYRFRQILEDLGKQRIMEVHANGFAPARPPHPDGMPRAQTTGSCQCDIKVGTVIEARIPRVTPPSMNSRIRE